jgi:hypothetical protein
MQPARAKKVVFQAPATIFVVQKDHACIRKVLASEEELVECWIARIRNLEIGSVPVFGRMPANPFS